MNPAGGFRAELRLPGRGAITPFGRMGHCAVRKWAPPIGGAPRAVSLEFARPFHGKGALGTSRRAKRPEIHRLRGNRPRIHLPRTSIDLSQPVTLLARALISQSEPVTADNGAYALSFGIETLSNSVGFGLANDGGTFRISDNSGQILSTAIDTSQFHDYRMVADFTCPSLGGSSVRVPA
jgi:hypothetical protein